MKHRLLAHVATAGCGLSGPRVGASYCKHRCTMLPWCQVKRFAAVAAVARSEVACGLRRPTQERGAFGACEDAAMPRKLVAVQFTPKALILLRNHGLRLCCLTFELSCPRRQVL